MGDLTEHFSRAELTHTDQPFDNTPDSPVIWDRLERVATMLERIRAKLACAIKVNSGYRSDAVNKAVGGSETSAHHLGLAADICPVGMDLIEAYKVISMDLDLMKDIDQLIWEQKATPRGGDVRWIHVGIGHGPNADLPLRHQTLIFSPKTGGHYPPFDESLIA